MNWDPRWVRFAINIPVNTAGGISVHVLPKLRHFENRYRQKTTQIPIDPIKVVKIDRNCSLGYSVCDWCQHQKKMPKRKWTREKINWPEKAIKLSSTACETDSHNFLTSFSMLHIVINLSFKESKRLSGNHNNLDEMTFSPYLSEEIFKSFMFLSFKL